MYASFAKNSPAPVGADLLSLSWKGDARRGWLVSGNSRKTVGVTYTQLTDDDEFECDLFESTAEQSEISLERQANRRNFNFREHAHEVSIVRWNKHLDKIATCDTSGTVIVWRNHNGRSIMELVNNRGTAISDFQWSNDGNKVLIAYVDGYVLVGTAYGRRIWARQLNLGSFVTNPNSSSQPSSLLSSTWSPDDSRIVVGSSIGELIELDAVSGGTLVSTTEVLPGIGIIGLQWVLVPKTAASSADIRGSTSPKDGQSSSLARGQIASPVINQPLSGQQQQGDKSSNNVRLSLYLKNGKVVLMNSCGDQQATIIRTGLVDGRMLWSSDGAILAVAGFRKSQSMSTVRFFQPSGQLLFTLPLRTKEVVTAITWAHQDQKFFVATKSLLHSVNIHRGIPSLQALCQTAVASSLAEREDCFELVLPTKLKVAVAESFDSVVQGHIPKRGKLLDYVTSAPPPSHRIYCTVYPNHPPRDHSNSSTNSSGGQRSRHPTSYTLFVEHLGTLIPILEAHKRSTKIRQSFTISLPNRAGQSRSTPQPRRQVLNTSEGISLTESRESTVTTNPSQLHLYSPEAHTALNTESGHEVACREDDSDSPRHPLIGSVNGVSATVGHSSNSSDGSSKLSSENGRQLAEVTSNVMASKFKIQGVNEKVPADMGSIMIKTSFLHIQPRKVIAYLPHAEQRDSGIETDGSSDESSSEDNLSSGLNSCSADVFMEPENQTIEELLSMEELLAPKPKSTDMDTRQAEQNVERPQPHSESGMGTGVYNCSSSNTSSNVKGQNQHQLQQRVSMSDSHVQIHSKTPTWNEQHMIYQLDFGGRVTTKSAKNFQLELEDEQVLQFGRIDNGCFILDFQAPFSPIQAFATALANLV